MMNKVPQSSIISSRSRGAFEIALLYLLTGILWIVFSDEAVAVLAPNQAALTQISIYKGWGYVLVTALFLYWMIRLHTLSISRAEQTLRQSAKNYEELLQQASDGILIADAQGQYILVNDEACRLVGYTKEELLSMHIRELVAPEELTKTPLRLDELRAGKTLITERKLVRKDGSRILCEVSAKQLTDGRLQSIIRDITERKVSDEALMRSEQRYRSLFENMTNGFARCQMLYENNIPTDFVYLDINDAFKKLTGLQNVIGKRVSAVIPGIRESNPEVFEIYGRVALTGEPEKFETYVPGMGSGVWFSVSVYSTEKDFFVAVFETITERKQMEIELRQTLINLENAEDQARLGSWYFDTSTNTGWWSRQMYRLFELDPANGVPSNEDYLQMIHPEDRELLALTLTQIAQGIPPEKRDFRINPKSGIVRTLSPFYHVEKDATGRVIKFSGTVLDTTEHKRAENITRASLRLTDFASQHSLDELLQKTLDEVCALVDSPIGFYHFVEPDQQTLSLQAWSTRTLKEYCKAEGKGLHYNVNQAGVWVDCIRERRPVVHNAYAALPHRKGLPSGHAELVRELVVPIMREGLIVAILGVGNKAQDYDEKDVDLVAYFADISWEILQRKRGEETLRASEYNYRSILEQASDGIFIADASGRYIEVNRSGCDMLGYSRNEILERSMKDLVSQDELASTPFKMDDMLAGRVVINERNMLRKDGSVIPVEISGRIFPDGRLQGIVRDITERKETEARLRHSEEQYRLMFTSNPLPIWVFDRETFAFLAVNDAAIAHYGYSREEFLQMTIKDIRPPEDIPILLKIVATKSEPYINVGVFRHRKKDGTLIDVEITRHEILFDGREALMVLAHDVTEQKRTEIALKQSEEKFRALFQNAQIGMYRSKLDGSAILEVNQKLCEIFGYSEEELLGNPATIRWANAAARERMVVELRNSGTFTDYEVEILTKSGAVRTCLASAQLNRELDYLEGSILDITERKQAEEKLKASEFRFRLAAESLTDVIYEWDIKEKVDWFGDVDALMGYAPGTFPRTLTGWAALLHPEDQERVLAAVDAQLKGDAAYNIEYRVATKRGEWRWWSARGVALRNPQGEPYHWIGSISDITERMQQDEALKKSEAKYRTLHESMIDGFVSVDMHGNFLECNEVYRNMLGYSDAELAALTYVDITPENWHAYETDIVENQILKRGFSDIYEKEYRRKDGTIFPVELHTVLLHDEAGIPSGMWAIVRDITERKQAEEKLLQSEEKFRGVFEHSPLGKSLTTMTGELRVNQAFCKIVGYSEAELSTKNWKEITHPDDIQESLDVIQMLIDGKISSANFEKRYIHKLGHLVWTDVTTALQRDENGQPLYFLTSIQDITERKRSEEEYRAIIKTAMDGFWITDSVGRFLDVNDAYCQLTGYARQELLKMGIQDVEAAENPADIRQHIQKLMATGSDHFETRHRCKDGRIVDIDVSANFQADRGGRIYVFLRDITGRKQVEAKLRESEERFSKIFHASPMGINIFRLSDNCSFDVNEAYLKIVGYAREEVVGHSAAELKVLVDLEARASWMKALGERKSVRNQDMRVRQKSGEIRDALTSIDIIDINGETMGFVVAMDITERKAAEEKLAYQAHLLANVSDALTASDEKFNLTAWNCAAEQMFGWKAEEVLGKPGAEIFRTEFIGIERAEVFRSVMETGAFRGEMIQYRKDGTPIFVEGNTFALRDENGKITGFVTATRDISERKQAEDELRQSRENFAKAFNSNPAAIAITRLVDGKFININPAYTRIMEYEPAEILDRTAAELNIYVHPDERAQVIQQLREQGTVQNYELLVRTKSGETRSIVVSMEPLLYNEEECILSVFIDISERKIMEMELQRSNAELEQFAYVASHDLQEPLRAVAGMVQLLQQRYQSKLDERADEYIGHAVEAATRMQSLINDLLEYSRVNRLGKSFENTATEKSLHNALANLQTAIRESNAEITHDPLPSLMVDPAQLTQLLQNLIGNGIKFRGERPLHIHIGAKKIEQAWQFSVSDNGIGIDPKYYERIFLVFQRLHTRREYPGTGIGLALCKKIIERHNGQIWVESQPGLGSTFYFTIPE